MTSVVRHITINGSADDILTSANADAGDDVADIWVTRTLADGDIGTASGQIQDTTSDPTIGCLAAEITGSRVVAITDIQLWRGTAAAHTTVFYGPVTGTGANTVNIRAHVTYNAQKGVSRIYLIDTAADAPGKAVADDMVIFKVLLGRSVPDAFAG